MSRFAASLILWILSGTIAGRGEARPETWEEAFQARRQWWSFQPPGHPAPPGNGAAHPIDAFLEAKLEARGLEPARPAEAATLLRRVTLALTGLPPTRAELRDFLADRSPDAYGRLVDRLLGSPRFGEHWARHWMDLVRFAETHGSEGDPEIPNAWRYRDYLIRALNGDVPWDRLIAEQIAGDLLPDPRLNESGGIDESMLGIAQLRFVEHGFNPVDTLDEQVKTIDNQIDVISKAFQGLTISCARCHDHKFDPISQREYYALYGIFASVRATQVTIDIPARLRAGRKELGGIKGAIKAALAEAWESQIRELGSAGAAELAAGLSGGGLHERSGGAESDAAARARKWNQALASFEAERPILPPEFREPWDLISGREWFASGANPPELAAAGDFSVEPEGPKVIAALLPAGIYSHLLSQKHNGVFASPRFRVETDYISVLAVGGKGARVRLIPDNYPIGQGNIFPQTELSGAAPRWVRLNTAYRKGSMAYLEFATAGEVTSRDRAPAGAGGRSYFGVRRIVFHDAKELPPAGKLSAGETEAAAAVRHWRENTLSGRERALLNHLLEAGLLPVQTNDLPGLAPLLRRYRELEERIPVPRRAPGAIEADAADAPLLVRGDHLKPQETVPRGYLRVVSDGSFGTRQSGRLELAREIAGGGNPLTARVMVNRVWHHLFGRGIVATVDNFGLLGEKPSHPELLDYLARRFVADGWSAKRLIRLMVTSRAYRASSAGSARAAELDPDNVLLSHMPVRRLEAEAVRDSLLAIGGRLDGRMYGPGENALAEALAQRRRSVYLTIRRNFLNPFLETFDAPRPFTTLGRRETTNVPAQSLALLNDPFVSEQASRWAAAVLEGNASAPGRVIRMFEEAFARPPDERELAGSLAYVDGLGGDAGAWRDLAQSLFNLKEFIYVP